MVVDVTKVSRAGNPVDFLTMKSQRQAISDRANSLAQVMMSLLLILLSSAPLLSEASFLPVATRSGLHGLGRQTSKQSSSSALYPRSRRITIDSKVVPSILITKNSLEDEGENTNISTGPPSPSPEEEAASTNGSSSSNALLQAKLHVLEDVVAKLNITKQQDQEQIQTLDRQVATLENELQSKERHYRKQLKAQEKHYLSKQNEWQEERSHIKKQHERELENMQRRLKSQAQLNQDSMEQQVRKETKQWKAEKEQEWKESLEIATAAVAAAEKREYSLQCKLDEMEKSYQEEAADYKRELDELRDAWTVENQRLEEVVERLQKELAERNKERNKETTLLINRLTMEKKQLQNDLQEARDQVQFQRLQYTTQQKMALERFEEQRHKERKFYTETIRLLQQENLRLENRGGLLKRLMNKVGLKRRRGVGGSSTGRSDNSSSNRRRRPVSSG
jgi:chromosome segregation ATPase